MLFIFYNNGSMDSALMRFQMNNSTDQFDDNVDKLLTSYSSDQSFQWNPIKKKPEGPSSEEVLSPKPITQCNNRCEKRECVECESLSTGSVTQPFICGVKTFLSASILHTLYTLSY